MSSLTGAKASQSVTIRMALAQTTGKVFNVLNTAGERDTKMFMVCPACEAAKVSQVYTCNDGCVPSDAVPSANPHGWSTGNITSRGQTVGDKIVVMTEEEIAEAKAPALLSGVLELSIHPAEQVDAATVANGAVYYFDPEKADAFFALLVDKVSDRTVAVLGNLAMRSSVKLYRLDVHFDGGLLLREMVRPEALHRFEEVRPPTPKDKEAAMFTALFDALTEDFNPEMFASDALKNLRALVESKRPDAEVIPITDKTAAAPEPDALLSALEASLAFARAKQSA